MLYKLENLKNNISEEVFVTHKKQDSMGTFVLFSFYQKRPQYSFDFLQHLSHHPTTLRFGDNSTSDLQCTLFLKLEFHYFMD